jgi:hypothetical protein
MNRFFSLFSAATLLIVVFSFANQSTANTKHSSSASYSESTLIDCIGFEDLNTGDNFGTPAGDVPGDTLLIEQGVVISLTEFLDEDGNIQFGNGTINDSPLSGMILNYPFFNFLGLHFDFSNVGIADKIVFPVFEGASPVNLSVNGAPVEVFSSLDDVPFNLAPGVTFQYNSNVQLVTLSGQIEQFQLGGIEFALDNVCFSLLQCALSDYAVDILPCNDNEFSLKLDLEFQGVSDSFDISIDDDYFGTFAYSDLPVTIGPFDGDNQSAFELTVVDQEEANCLLQTDPIGPVDCSCNLKNLDVFDLECLDNGKYKFAIDVQANDPSNLTFDLFLDSEYIDSYNFDDLPILIEDYQTDDLELEVKICESGSSGCCISEIVTLPSCDCAIFDLEANVFDCRAGEFYVELTYDFEETGPDGFTLFVNDDFYGEYPYLGVVLAGPFEANDTTAYIFTLVDQANDQCSAEVEIGPVVCDEVCEIEEIIVNSLSCDTSGTYTILLDLVYENVSDSFSLIINDEKVGDFSYDDLPLEVGPFKEDGVIIVCDLGNDLCCQETTFDFSDCACDIYNVEYELSSCNPNGIFSLTLDFGFANTGNSFIIQDQNGQEYGPFDYDNLPVTFGSFEGDGISTFKFEIIDQGLGDPCTEIFTVGPVDCAEGCVLERILVSDIECTGPEEFSVLLDLEFNNNISDSFTVENLDTLYGTFAYDDLPVRIEGISSDNGIIVVTDLDNPDCSIATLLAFQGCVCNLSDLELEPLPCTADGTFFVSLDFDFFSVSDSFVVADDNTFYGIFSYDDLPVEIGPFVGDGFTPYGLFVFDQKDPDCTLSGAIDPVDCLPGDCVLANPEVVDFDCSNDGSYFVFINFDFDETSDSFTVFTNNAIQTFAYDDLPVAVGPLTGTQVLEICDSQKPNCCTVLTVSDNICPCSIDEPAVEILPCVNTSSGSPGVFSVLLDFEHFYTSDSFTLTGNGALYGTFAYSDLPIEVGPFAGDNQTVYELIINDTEKPNCGAFTEFGPVDCVDDCGFENIEVLEITCNSDGTYDILLDFDAIEVQGIGVELILDGELFNFYLYDEVPPILIQGYETDEEAVGIILCDNDNPDCCSEEEFFFLPECEPCDIHPLELEVSDCNDNGQFFVDLTFDAENTSDFFLLFINDDLFGTFAYDDLPLLEVGPLDGDGVTAYTFLVKDQDKPDCATEKTIDPVDCIGDCHINDLVVEIYDCDDNGQFLVDIDFNFENTSDSFLLFVNDDLFGTFAYDDLFITAGPFDGDGTTAYTFLVKDQDNPDCATEKTIDPVDCVGDCHINDLVVETYDCDDNGQFLVDIDFNFENTSDSFLLFINNDLFGTFAYDDLPLLEVGPLDGDGTTAYTFLVKDQDNSDCAEDKTIDPVDCPLGDCLIEGLELSTFCDGTTGFLELTFDSEFTSDSFIVQSCFEIATFAYGQSSYIIEITPDIEDCALGNVLPIGVYDQNNPNGCFDFSFILLPDCENNLECEITDLTLEASDCEDGEFFVFLDFEFENVSDSFAVLGNGDVYGVYSYDDLPVEIGPFEGDGLTIYEFGVIDLGDLGCSAFGELGPIDCTECSLSNLSTEFYCEGPTTFIEFDFDYEGTSDSFNVFTCFGINLGTFAYGEAPYTVSIEPDLLGCFGGGTFIIFSIQDQENNNTCFILDLLELPDCPNECSVYNVEAEVLECENGAFTAALDFETNMTGDLGFVVFINGDIFGPFDYGDQPLEFGPLPADGTFYDFLVVDLEDPFCFGYADLGQVECPDCELSDLSVAFDCNLDGTYNAEIDFFFEDVQNDFFDVYVNDSLLGSFEFAALPLTLDSLLLDSDEATFTVCENDNPNCCTSLTVDVPECLTDCIEVDANLPDTTFFASEYAIGDQLFSIADIDAFVADPVLFDWEPNGSITLSPPGELLMSGALELDFSNLDEEEKTIAFDLLGPLWLSVNGSPVNAYLPTNDTTFTIGTVAVTISNNGQHVSLSGEIETLAFGTEDGIISNICYALLDDDLWPGDVNLDNIANHLDLLSIGLAFGKEGPKRVDESTDWEALIAEDWGIAFEDGTDMKHADCDGNGEVELEDINVIKKNYNKTHGPVEVPVSTFGDDNDPPIFLDFSKLTNLSSGQAVNIPLVLGVKNQKVEDIYGLAIRMEYSPQALTNVAPQVVPGWFGQGGSYIHLLHHDEAKGVIELAITRLNKVNASGHGNIALFIGIIDDLAGLQVPDIEITEIIAIDADENPVMIFVPEPGEYPQTDKKNDIPNKHELEVYPNPSDGYIYVEKKSNERASGMRILNMRGEIIHSREGDFEQHLVDGSAWNAGLYFIEVRLETEVLIEKVQIVRP